MYVKQLNIMYILSFYLISLSKLIQSWRFEIQNNDCNLMYIMLNALIFLSHTQWLFLSKQSTFCLLTYKVHLLINIKHSTSLYITTPEVSSFLNKMIKIQLVLLYQNKISMEKFGHWRKPVERETQERIFRILYMYMIKRICF